MTGRERLWIKSTYRLNTLSDQYMENSTLHIWIDKIVPHTRDLLLGGISQRDFDWRGRILVVYVFNGGHNLLVILIGSGCSPLVAPLESPVVQHLVADQTKRPRLVFTSIT